MILDWRDKMLSIQVSIWFHIGFIRASQWHHNTTTMALHRLKASQLDHNLWPVPASCLWPVLWPVLAMSSSEGFRGTREKLVSALYRRGHRSMALPGCSSDASRACKKLHMYCIVYSLYWYCIYIVLHLYCICWYYFDIILITSWYMLYHFDLFCTILICFVYFCNIFVYGLWGCEDDVRIVWRWVFNCF